MERIIYSKDGKVCVIIPAPGVPLESLLHLVPADAEETAMVRKADMPASRVFRDAWKLEAGAVAVDRVKAEKIVTDRIRREREAEFAKTDAEYMAAVQKGDTAKAQAAAARAQKLRDAPAKDLSKLTLDELAAVTLGSLLE